MEIELWRIYMEENLKQLLLKDLCARLPFHVKVAIDFEGYLEVLPDDENLQYPYRKNLNSILDYDNKTIEDISKEPHILYAYPCTERFAMLRGYTYELDYGVPVEFIKPYLRPISSITEEEKKELFEAINKDMNLLEETLDKEPLFIYHNNRYIGNPIHYELDFLISHYFDYRGLIPMGLALEAFEDMYNIK